MSAVERFMQKVDVTDGCWNWTAAKKGNGYGAFYFEGALRGAHRVSLHLFKGLPVDTPLDAMHSCDNPGCVNPDHLSYGTRVDNMQDASCKGRTRNVSDWSGAKNPKAKLAPNQRTELEGMISAGRGTRELAREFGITRARVQQIAREMKAKPKKDGGGWAEEDFSRAPSGSTS